MRHAFCVMSSVAPCAMCRCVMVMVAVHSQSRDFFFDLVFVSGVFGKYARKSKLVVWLV